MKGKYLPLIIYLIGSFALYIHQGYFTERIDFDKLFFDYSLLFMFYILFVERIRFIEEKYVLRAIILFGISTRLALLFHEPNLSDDFYRFLWDGNMLIGGENPYLILPEIFQASNDVSGIENLLFEKMNSPNYFTVYPPLNQYLFGMAALLSPTSLYGQILVLKSILFLFELIVIFTLPLLIKDLGQPIFYSALYILNPLVIIETIGNLHFEGISVSLLVLTFYFLLNGKNKRASIFLGLAAGIKLIPFLLFPLLWRKNNLLAGFLILLVASAVFSVFFIPFVNSELIENISTSVLLYFQSFEFNASIYFIIREVGFWIKGYNIIETSGYVLALISGILVLFYSLKLNIGNWPSFFAVANICFISYYLLSTTVHPWYLLNVLLFSSLSGMYMTGITWSFLAFLSYQTYGNPLFTENVYLLCFEYIIVLSVLAFEIRNSNKTGLLKLSRIRFDSK